MASSCTLSTYPTPHARTDETSADVRECEIIGGLSCPGSDNNGSICETDEYCTCGWTGPLCSECAVHHFMASDGCQLCRDIKTHLPRILIGSGIVVVAGIVMGLCYVNSSHEKMQKVSRLNTGVEALGQLYQSGQVKFFILLLMFQVLSQFAQNVASSGKGSYPEPALTFVEQLGLANFDVVALVPIDCMHSNTDFCTSHQ